MTTGSVEPLKKLFHLWGEKLHFVDVLVRQAHPGPGVAPYHSDESKLQDGRRYQEEEQISWPVVVDNLKGTVHQAYGGLFDPTYLIDLDGRVAFYCLWTHVPTLHEAIAELLQRGGAGVVHGGIDASPHVLPALTAGWRGIERGLWQSFFDLESAAPGMASALWLGQRLQPALAPLTQRARPLPPLAQAALWASATALIGALWRRRSRCQSGAEKRAARRDSRGRAGPGWI